MSRLWKSAFKPFRQTLRARETFMLDIAANLALATRQTGNCGSLLAHLTINSHHSKSRHGKMKLATSNSQYHLRSRIFGSAEIWKSSGLLMISLDNAGRRLLPKTAYVVVEGEVRGFSASRFRIIREGIIREGERRVNSLRSIVRLSCLLVYRHARPQRRGPG